MKALVLAGVGSAETEINLLRRALAQSFVAAARTPSVVWL